MLKYLNYLIPIRDPESFWPWIRDPGWKKFGSAHWLEGRIQSRNFITHSGSENTVTAYIFQILLPPDAGGAAAPLGGSHDLQRRHLAAQVHEEGHGKRLNSSWLID